MMDLLASLPSRLIEAAQANPFLAVAVAALVIQIGFIVRNMLRSEDDEQH